MALATKPYIGRGMLVRLSIAGAVCLVAVGLVLADPSWSSIKRPTHVESQPLGPALEVLAKEHGLQILYRTEVVGHFKTQPLDGNLTADEALSRLLSGSGLTYRYLEERAVTIIPVSAISGAGGAGASSPSSGPPVETQQEGKRDSSGTFLLAQAASGQAAGAPSVEKPPEATSQTNPVQLQEVLVTAQKRAERLIDTPQSVSVVSTDELNKLAATQFVDFANSVPGLNFTTAGPGYTQISLRGVTTGFDIGPTIGIYVDEVPYGSSNNFGAGAQRTLDVGLFDLDRIEVLRGPQGTLYGASTMGGLLKYVTRQPDPTSFSGAAQAGVSDTGDGGGVSYNLAGVLNAPVVQDKAAVRLSAYESHDGGYIDNVALNQKDVNSGDIYGGRLDLLIRPSEALSIRLIGFWQDISRNGESTADYTAAGVPQYGSLDQFRKFAEPFNDRFSLYSGTVAYDFGPATLTSISSYQTDRSANPWDASAVYVPLLNGFGFGPYSAVADLSSSNTNKFTQEMRLAGKPGQTVEWLIGGFYTNESNHYSEQFLLRDLAGQPTPNNLYTYITPSTYKEYAGFGDLTWHLTSELDVTGGARLAHNDQSYASLASSLFTVARPTATSSDSVTTYLADARYHFSSNAMGYLRYATGYRPGGPNFPITDASGNLLAAPTFAADTLKSYEIGFKGETSDRRYSIDVDLYDIDWSNIQISIIRGGFGFIGNAPSGATVQGSELSLTAHPVDSFVLSGAFAYEHAYMKDTDADLGASAGERLPNVPRVTASVNGDYQLWNGDLRPTVGASVRYVSDRYASFDANGSFRQYRLPAYTSVDLRTGMVFESRSAHPINLQVYVHNVFDERGQLSSDLPQFGDRITILQPRTVGLTASTTF